jgi:hypothetical protein
VVLIVMTARQSMFVVSIVIAQAQCTYHRGMKHAST